MTAINAFVRADAFHVLTDGALQDVARGCLHALGHKVAMLTGHRAVMAVRGFRHVTSDLPIQLDQVGTFDELSTNFADVTRSYLDAYAPAFAQAGYPPAEQSVSPCHSPECVARVLHEPDEGQP